ncbi:IclR family transcriptional regulator domain-containing protein [Aquipuribacter nitratireducens]|uniref:IclR family transcriptional regulator C-terminal domain-containing protein n=1 Tax=Aquipuribacter nitratireducens TaxID=650104 RepID=A0ABW0GRY7_9MICO
MTTVVGRAEVHVSSETFVRSLERGLAVIRAFDAEHPRLSLSEVARRTGLTRAAARRFLLTLVELGYVHASDGVFSLRPRVLELGFAYLSGLRLVDVAHPHMQSLSDAVHESVSVSVLDGDDLVYVGRVHARKIMTVALDVGSRLPAYCTSMGRVLLAHAPADRLSDYLARVDLVARTPHTVTDAAALAEVLDRVRADGFAVVDQELELGLRSVAVPLHARGGEVVAAMNVAAPLERGSLEEIRAELLPPLLAAARECEADLLAV